MTALGLLTRTVDQRCSGWASQQGSRRGSSQGSPRASLRATGRIAGSPLGLGRSAPFGGGDIYSLEGINS